MNLAIYNCKSNGKAAVVEIKSALTREQTDKLIEEIDSEGYLSSTIFISFNAVVLLYIRGQLPDVPIQMLALRYKQVDLDFLQENRFGIDINHSQLTKERLDEYHNRGIEVNCWTVNNSRRSKMLQEWGIDFITTDKMILCIKGNF